MEINPQHVKLATALPKRLLDFFRKYPPPALTQGLAAPASASTPASQETPAVASTTSSEDPNVPAIETGPSALTQRTYRNPFQPTKNFATGKWNSPVFGLRRQADIVKLAQKHGVVDLLPYTIKLPGEREKRRAERGLRVKGTGVGERVKGKAWERTLKGRLEERRNAMLAMPQMIEDWKQVCLVCVRGLGGVAANWCTERSRKGVEEVAEIEEYWNRHINWKSVVKECMLECCCIIMMWCADLHGTRSWDRTLETSRDLYLMYTIWSILSATYERISDTQG
jgi:large subunit ribosomal protein L25